MKKPSLFAGLSLLLIFALAALPGCGAKDENREPYIVVDEAAAPHRDPHQSGDITVAEKTIRVSLPVPTPAWTVAISEVWVVGRQIWAICELKQADGMAAQVVSAATNSVTVRVPDLPVTYYIIGRSFDGLPDDGNFVFIPNKAAISALLDQGQQVYPSGS